MSTNSILNIPYTYPVPTLASKADIEKTNNEYHINKVYDKYNEYFKGNDEDVNGVF